MRYANSHTFGLGTVLNRFVGDGVEQVLSDVCGIALGWLKDGLLGPSMYAFGWFEGGSAPIWKTNRPDFSSYRTTLSSTEGGGQAAWRADCAARDVAVAQVWNWHIFTPADYMGSVRVRFASIPAAALCSGWAWVPGSEGEGIIGATVRVQVEGPRECAGVTGTTLEDFTVR